METVAILIGNSDNKLTQKRWSEFVAIMRDAIRVLCSVIHFDGGSEYDSERQNACFVIEIGELQKHLLFESLNRIRAEFDQDSIATVSGRTIFLRT